MTPAAESVSQIHVISAVVAILSQVVAEGVLGPRLTDGVSGSGSGHDSKRSVFSSGDLRSALPLSIPEGTNTDKPRHAVQG